MSNLAIRIEYTLVFTSAFHIGSGYGMAGVVDATVVRHRNGDLYVPGSTIKGRTRWRLTNLLGGAPTGRTDVYNARSPVVRAKASGHVALVVATDDHIVPRAQADAYVARFPTTRVLEVPGGHFDVVAPWTEAWRSALGAIRDLLR